ncbi:MAG: hypothetical protein R3A12_14325 [Ignavibacteria bacterium]
MLFQNQEKTGSDAIAYKCDLTKVKNITEVFDKIRKNTTALICLLIMQQYLNGQSLLKQRSLSLINLLKQILRVYSSVVRKQQR